MCYCHHDQVLKIGLHSRVADCSQPPENTASLVVDNCHHVELYSRLLNHMHNIQNITIKNTHTVVTHPKLYEAKGAEPGSGSVHKIELTNINKLQVKRYSFKDLEVTNRFYLGEVAMHSVVSMAFDFKYVKEFSVFASKFDRISMFGIKLDQCKEFNVLGMTYFSTLGAHAIKVKCDKFSLAYNVFGRLHDSSFDVEYGLCDVQGNTFKSLEGKPFQNMRPQFQVGREGTNEIAMLGLVFRENKFPSEPILPFDSLAMPSYSLLSPTTSYLDIDSNQFPCSCQKLGWFLAFGKFEYNRVSLEEVGNTANRNSTSFTKQLYETAGTCIECDHMKCIETGEDLIKYSDKVLVFQTEHQLSCKGGLKIEKYDLKKSDTEESSVSMHHETRLKNVTELTDKENAFQESQRTVQKSVSSDLKNNKKGNRRRQENLMKTQESLISLPSSNSSAQHCQFEFLLILTLIQFVTNLKLRPNSE